MEQKKVIQEPNLCSLITSSMLPSQEANLDQLGFRVPISQSRAQQPQLSCVSASHYPSHGREDREKQALLPLHRRALKREGSPLMT